MTLKQEYENKKNELYGKIREAIYNNDVRGTKIDENIKILNLQGENLIDRTEIDNSIQKEIEAKTKAAETFRNALYVYFDNIENMIMESLTPTPEKIRDLKTLIDYEAEQSEYNMILEKYKDDAFTTSGIIDHIKANRTDITIPDDVIDYRTELEELMTLKENVKNVITDNKLSYYYMASKDNLIKSNVISE
ncbi:MAG TPA: hypothetical protein GX708_02015 [Gallicola sp.]|jgi:hypothetical protein|nr:hypothetical protein [Gallicola sp.]